MKIKSQRSKRGSRPRDYLLLPGLLHVLLVLVLVPLGQDPVIATISRAVVLGGAALELALHRGDLPQVVQLSGGGALLAEGGNGVGGGCVRVSLFGALYLQKYVPRCANRDYYALMLWVRCKCKTRSAVQGDTE